MYPKPRSSYLLDKQKRLSVRRKTVTIAAGILSRDGVTIAADTHEGYGETHTYVDKITVATGNTGQGAIASSGTGELLDYITPHIQRLIAEGNWSTLEEFEIQLQELMAHLYKTESIQSYPRDQASELYTQFLVAARHVSGTETRLFIVGSSLVTQATQLGTVIGCGPLREFVEEIGNAAAYNGERARMAALAIVHEAKRRYSDIGGRVSICTLLNKGSWNVEDGDKTAELELLADSARKVTNRVILATLDSTVTPGRFNEILKEVQINLRGIRKKARAIDARRRRELALQQNQMTKKIEKWRFDRKARREASQR